jgi:hypothetical protein
VGRAAAEQGAADSNPVTRLLRSTTAVVAGLWLCGCGVGPTSSSDPSSVPPSNALSSSGARELAVTSRTAAPKVLELEWRQPSPAVWALRLPADVEGLAAVFLEVPADRAGWRAGEATDDAVPLDVTRGELRVLGRVDRGWGAADLAGGQVSVRFEGSSPPAPIAVATATRLQDFVEVRFAGGAREVFAALPTEPLPELPPLPGEPSRDASPEELALFAAGRREFDRFVSERDGLGPGFNGESCFVCHLGPASGGSSERRVTHFASSAAGGRSFPEVGGPVLQERGIHPSAEELVPSEADVRVVRISPHLFGSGWVEAVDDGTLAALARAQPVELRGRVHWIEGREGAPPRAGRFGWKAQAADLLSFTAEAALEELGQTNRLFPNELHAGGDPRVTELYDRVPDPEIVPGEDGRDRLDRLVDFQRLLAPPPQTPADGHPGAALFERTGCAVCHTPRLATADGREFAPYSDFLLHDLASEGDGIRTGDAGPTEMRTAPLWGLTGRRFLWHDGAVAHAPFEELIARAVARHAGQGSAAREAFAALAGPERAALVDFLRSLGRAPHDVDADGRVTRADGTALLASLASAEGAAESRTDWGDLLDLNGDRRVGAAEWAAFARSLARAPAVNRALSEPRR